jgi:hypothetical protein
MQEIESRDIADKDIDGLAWHVRVVMDDEQPDAPDDDGATPAQVRAYQRGDWYYAGVIVTPVISGQRVTEADQSLWSVEYGRYTLTDENGNVTGEIVIDLDSLVNGQKSADGTEVYEPYPVPDLIAEAKAELRAGLPAMQARLADIAAVVAQITP